MKPKQILVLGVGNILLHDEGIGVHVVRDLEREYIFSENVTLLDGGTLGMRLLDAISKADYVIVLDTLCANKPPGQISRLARAELKGRVAVKNSMHQVSFLETIAFAEFLGILPDTVLIGCEPKDLSAWGTGLSNIVNASKQCMIDMAVTEIEKAGGQVSSQQGMG